MSLEFKKLADVSEATELADSDYMLGVKDGTVQKILSSRLNSSGGSDVVVFSADEITNMKAGMTEYTDIANKLVKAVKMGCCMIQETTTIGGDTTVYNEVCVVSGGSTSDLANGGFLLESMNNTYTVMISDSKLSCTVEEKLSNSVVIPVSTTDDLSDGAIVKNNFSYSDDDYAILKRIYDSAEIKASSISSFLPTIYLDYSKTHYMVKNIYTLTGSDAAKTPYLLPTIEANGKNLTFRTAVVTT